MAQASQAAVQARRRTVAGLWLRGIAPARIALQLETPLRTIQRDLESIRDELAEANRADLEQNRDRSVAVLRAVQEAAWGLFTKITSEAATNKVGALNTIVAAEERIARMQGTLTPEVASQTTINVLNVPEWAATRATLLAALSPYPEARVAAAEALAQLEAPKADDGGEHGTGN